jgi:ribose/xylose/arabinose/galactoside ABC-type transport system permease subunit
MWRTAVGHRNVASVSDILTLMARNSAIQSVAKGAIVILAVAFDAWTQQRQA